MNPAELFEGNLTLIERVARRVCWRGRVDADDADDFVSSAKLALLENDYAILRRFEGRSSLATFLAVIFQRMLADQRIRTNGRWNASREAERMGPAGVLLEGLVMRTRRSVDEALPLVRAVDPSLTRDAAAAMAARLPERAPRPRLVELADADHAPYAAAERSDEEALASDARVLSARVSGIMRDVLGAMTLEERTLIRLRYGLDMSVADVARMMRLPQRPLYRRIEGLLGRIRVKLMGAGINPADVTELIGTAASELDFDFADGESGEAQQTN